MINFGEVPLGAVLPVHFPSYGADGASLALSGLAVTDVEIYKGTSVTQRSSDAGYVLIDTDGIDIDGIVGANGFSIDTGDNTDAGFFVAGSYYNVWVASVTIDGKTVNVHAATFRLKPAETIAGVSKVDISHLLGTAWLTPGTAGTPDVNAKLWNGLTTVELPLVPVTAGRKLDVTAANKVNGVVLVDTLTTYTGNTPQTGDAFARIGATGSGLTSITAKTDNLPSDPADESLIIAATDALATAIAGVQSDTDNIQTRIPAALVGGRMDSSVGAMAANVLTAAATAADFGAEVADAYLDRNMATGTDSSSDTVRTPRSALRQIRNKFSISGVTITYTKEDDATPSHTGALSTDAAALPIIGYDPAGP